MSDLRCRFLNQLFTDFIQQYLKIFPTHVANRAIQFCKLHFLEIKNIWMRNGQCHYSSSIWPVNCVSSFTCMNDKLALDTRNFRLAPLHNGFLLNLLVNSEANMFFTSLQIRFSNLKKLTQIHFRFHLFICARRFFCTNEFHWSTYHSIDQWNQLVQKPHKIIKWSWNWVKNLKSVNRLCNASEERICFWFYK